MITTALIGLTGFATGIGMMYVADRLGWYDGMVGD
jgi:hypothetical protein